MDKRLLYLPAILFALAGAISAFGPAHDTGMGVTWLCIGVLFLTIAITQGRKSADS
jgi:hypothetical protein